QMNAYALPVQPGDRFILRSLEKVASAQLHLEFFHADGLPWVELGEVFSNGALQSKQFDFNETDTLLIVASDAGVNHAIAEYALSVQLLRPDCAVELACPADLSGSFSKPAQTEAFWFEVSPGQRYIIRAKATGSGFNGQFQLFTPAGDLHSQVTNNTLTFNDILDIPGAWILLLTEQDGDAVGAYTISFLAVGKASCSVEMACGQALSGNLSTASSLRQFRLTGAENEKLIVRGRGAIGSGVTPLLQLYKANGTEIGTGTTARRNEDFDAAGEYFLVVSDNSAASSGNFHLAAQIANDFTCGESISYNQTLSSSLGSQVEMDGFVFSGNQGDVVSIQAGVCSGTFDAQVELWNAGGLLQKMDFTDNGLARIDTFRLLASGSYKLLVMEKEGDETTGEYGICLQKVNPGVNAATLFPGTATVSAISKPAEMQVFTFYSEAGTPATLTMNALSGNLQSRMELFAPGGARLAMHTGTTTASINNFSLPVTGTYSVLALPATATPCGAGDFDLKLQAILFANPTQFSVACEGGSLSISITSNCPNWTLSPTAGWQGDPITGSYNQTVSVNIGSNASLLSRTGTIILTGCGISQTITVTQAGATFSASSLSFIVGNQEGQVQLDLTSECCAWQINSNNPNWLSANPD
ncbi:MAG: BACON domain-containing protein, partial [Bacteroidota bacterium]